MTVSTSANRADYNGNGASTAFAVPFLYLDPSHLQVLSTVIATGVSTTFVLNADYTVTPAGVATGGTLTTTVPVPSGSKLSILLNMPLVQPTHYVPNDPFPAASHEAALDYLTLLAKQTAEVASRSVQVPPGESGAAVVLPASGARAGYLLGFDGNGILTLVAAAAQSATALALSLLTNAGSASIGFIHSVVGAVGRTVQDKLRDTFSFTDVGAVADSTTDSLAAVNSALSTPRAEVVVREGADVKVSAMPTNSYGPRMGPGRVILPLTAPYPGRQQINSDTELQQQVFGQEYLYAAQTKLQARGAFTALFSGDSTTAGDSLVNTYSQIHALTLAVLRDKGFDLTTVNGGHSGVTAEQWRTTYLAGDLATNPDLYVIRWGVNDPGWNKNGTVGTTNAYEAEVATRRDITDYATTMRAALTTIRAAKDVTQLSIILMVPNSTADSPNGRDEKWYEQVRRVLRKCARDFQCAFIDTYAIWRDSRAASTRWMDNPFGDGRAIHPLDIMNNWIASTIGDLIIPSALAVRHVGSIVVIPGIAILPKAYPVGVSTFRASTWTINGVAVDGMVITHRGADGVCMQEVVNYSAQQRVSKRVGDCTSNTWQDWTSMPTNTTPLALSNAWAASGRGITYDKADGLVHLRGRITGGTTTTGTVIATLPVGCRPVFDEYRAVLCGSTLQTAAAILISASTGQIQVNVVSSNALLDVGCTFSTF